MSLSVFVPAARFENMFPESPICCDCGLEVRPELALEQALAGLAFPDLIPSLPLTDPARLKGFWIADGGRLLTPPEPPATWVETTSVRGRRASGGMQVQLEAPALVRVSRKRACRAKTTCPSPSKSRPVVASRWPRNAFVDER